MVVNVFISAVTRDNLSRKDAVAWINDVLKSHFTKVEEMSSGAAYCQFTHLLFGVINLKKVKFNPRNEPEVLNNWKALTTAWKDIGIDKPVEVEKLKKGKFQDNMEFLQWFYKFFHANLSDQLVNYDAIGARAGEDLPALKGVTRAPPTARSVATAPAPAPTRNVVRPSAGSRPVPSRNDTIVKELEVKCEEQKALATQWEIMAKEMETEREFYFNMLQKVEELVNSADEQQESAIPIESLKKVLFGENREEKVGKEDNSDEAYLF